MKKIKIQEINYKYVTVIAEFQHTGDELTIISELSNYIHNICSNDDLITTDIQYFQAGYRITFKLRYTEHKYLKFKNKNYSKKLAKVSDWLDKIPQSQALTRYHYNINSINVF